jgi:hypothetical protein
MTPFSACWSCSRAPTTGFRAAADRVDADLSKLLDGIDLLAQGGRFRLVVMPGRTRISAALQARLAASRTEVVEGPSTIDSIAERTQLPRLHIVATAP